MFAGASAVNINGSVFNIITNNRGSSTTQTNVFPMSKISEPLVGNGSSPGQHYRGNDAFTTIWMTGRGGFMTQSNTVPTSEPLTPRADNMNGSECRQRGQSMCCQISERV